MKLPRVSAGLMGLLIVLMVRNANLCQGSSKSARHRFHSLQIYRLPPNSTQGTLTLWFIFVVVAAFNGSL